jgi:hypothetical protein
MLLMGSGVVGSGGRCRKTRGCRRSSEERRVGNVLAGRGGSDERGVVA